MAEDFRIEPATVDQADAALALLLGAVALHACGHRFRRVGGGLPYSTVLYKYGTISKLACRTTTCPLQAMENVNETSECNLIMCT
eukprot:COSAG02_NODE_8814_length_2435_cov_1.459760_4_plen_84_part_01